MRVVLQRVTHASVVVDGRTTGAIEQGLMVLVGVGHDSTDADARWLATKVEGLRVFSDEAGKMNRSVADVGGGVLAISQFTLYGTAQKGRRPSFVDAAPPAEGERLYEVFCDALTVPVGRGVFGADMQITMTADGPVTLTVESHGRR
ncbi:D-aminoacyl-tRNA deacylase [Euzebya tangerina]|uniref:D-aminoacyl-tRNA deacylase n=1 Tax=Euzebya tangerina TaxID=591198 RepID=UPI000E320718|nr:D-aminoacyl-tRNA deacylase [Euzebya tangerina]